MLANELLRLGVAVDSRSMQAVNEMRQLCKLLKGTEKAGEALTESISNSPVEIGNDVVRSAGSTPPPTTRNTNRTQSRSDEPGKKREQSPLIRLKTENELRELPPTRNQ